ncbi:MAG: DUF4867 family protein [Fusobacteriaceae bacterium]
MLKKLNDMNSFQIYSYRDKEFSEYGKVLSGYDFSKLVEYADENTAVPEKGNIYHGSVSDLEKIDNLREIMEVSFYGGMEAQIGYCNGRNNSLNGLEYHKGSEINVAVTDLVLLLAKTTEIENGEFHSSKVKAFYLPKGAAVEIYQTTMHFAPCKVQEEGFKCIVILPKGTNEEISLDEKKILISEDQYLFKRNKWLIVHEDKQDLIAKGAFLGIKGENLQLNYQG